MQPAEMDIEIGEGSDFYQDFVFLDDNGVAIDITGATAAAQVRQQFADLVPLFTFTIINGGASGKLTIKLLSTDTANPPIPYPLGKCDRAACGVWDLFFVDTNGLVTGIAGQKVRLVKGTAYINARVTR